MSRRKGLGSARVPHAGDGVLAIANFSEKIVSARRRNQHARRVRYPELILALQEMICERVQSLRFCAEYIQRGVCLSR